MSDTKTDYKASGVDVARGYKAVELMKAHVKKTYDGNVLGDLGSFGGFYSLEGFSFAKPVLVAGTDGVGTKLKYAFLSGRNGTIGQDCVAMCANDVVCQGAKPLFFLDYYACGVLDPEVCATVVGGVANGCVQAGCALIGGETAEMPGFYPAGEYDLAGFCVGIADRDRIINGGTIAAGDALVGLASSGIHSNGFSLVRKVLGEDVNALQGTPFAGGTLLDAILTPTRIYVKTILALAKEFTLKGVAHITGGGFFENIPRIFPKGLGGAVITDYEKPPIIDYLAARSGLRQRDLYGTFNMGVGMVLCVAKEDVQAVTARAAALGERAFVLGEVIEGDGITLL
ncbi:MAG: phosphoribosylformylglycinamidine cyclo-ligase [Clostridiales bacterium]|jgi:phosphoribosylformylglycinamidine cyclo-ligase|nr:phosphoribosylformylglycinamidine cyclo-ligase [Clostridiales bacterium]